jgi:opacity protein-like surface antigen
MGGRASETTTRNSRNAHKRKGSNMTAPRRTTILILFSVAAIAIAIAPRSARAQGQNYPPPPRYPLPSYPGSTPPSQPPSEPPPGPPAGPPPSAPPAAYPPYPAPASYGYEDDARVTISPFIGVRFGGRIDIDTPNVDYLPISSSFNGGFNVGVAIVPKLFGEFMWNRQSTTLSAHDIDTGDIHTLTDRFHMDLWQLSLLYEFPTASRLRPFVVGGFGFTHFDSHGVLNFDNRLSYNLGAGVKYLFTPQVALRAELRWSPSRTTSSSTTFCDPSLGCFTTPVSNHAEQGQANIGLEFRFR